MTWTKVEMIQLENLNPGLARPLLCPFIQKEPQKVRMTMKSQESLRNNYYIPKACVQSTELIQPNYLEFECSNLKTYRISHGLKRALNLNVLEYYLFTIIIIILHCDCTLLHFWMPFLWIACLMEMEVASRPVDESTRGELQFFFIRFI